jgi:transcriptional regulator with XRE-family HTH domain
VDWDGKHKKRNACYSQLTDQDCFRTFRLRRMSFLAFISKRRLTMTLAQRVRDCRYSKGWGPDELASRADISRTALYQIESGKTEQPRASTLRRIAEALSVSTENLLGQSHNGTPATPAWNSSAESGLGTHRIATELHDDPQPFRFATLTHPAVSHNGGWSVSQRERDLERKFVELLRSPLGEGLARIVEETHRILPTWVEAIH